MTFNVKEKETWLPLLIVTVYFLLLYFSIDVKTVNVVFVLILLLGYYIHPNTRKIIFAFAPLLAYIIIYDLMRGFPNYFFKEVNIKGIYEFEKKIFGILTRDGLITLNEYFKDNTNDILDFLGGVIYANWVNIPIVFAIYLYVKDKRKMLEFLLSFLLLNIFGMTTYYLIPVAPPWYVELYGFEFDSNVSGYPAGLINFDKMFDIHFFQNMYEQMNSQVFAALPSLHSAFPALLLCYSLKKVRYANIPILLYGVSVCFFAVYLRHHYLIDILLGVSYAVVTFFLMNYLSKNKKVDSLLKFYEKKVTS